ncbi:MAG: hypothetical protein OEU91_11180 [Gammaproteobacteria bacterium]|nr:hypothetical protein [Gammaproteobacteria bacterium]
MKFSTIAIAAAMCVSGSAFAKPGNDVISDDLSRRGPGSTSGSGHTVEGNCGGPDYQGATGKLTISQNEGSSTVNVEVEDAVPNTHFTVWMRIKGGAGFNDAGSPWTGGGATPLCSGTDFASLNANSPWNNPAGSTDHLCNSFTTDANGDGTLNTTVNFPVVGGAYPFQQADGPARPGHDDHADVPTAIVDPRTGTGGPFMIRVVSHCLDNANHGLSPSNREAFFQYP